LTKHTPRENGWKYFAINLTDTELRDINYKLDCIRLMYAKIEHPLVVRKTKETNKKKLHNKEIIKHLVDNEYQVFLKISKEVLNEENNVEFDADGIIDKLLGKTHH
tara:strand:+ start:35 stop:352 length:318 start_codon:yes stop_codon:yes gene_type:complete